MGLHESSGFHRWYPNMAGKRTYTCWIKHVRKAIDGMYFPRGKAARKFCCFPEKGKNLQTEVYNICTNHGAHKKAARQTFA